MDGIDEEEKFQRLFNFDIYIYSLKEKNTFIRLEKYETEIS